MYRVYLESHAFYKRVENLEKVSCTVCYCKFVNFREGLFSRNFAYVRFRENEIFTKWRNHSVILSFTDMVKSCPSHEFIVSQICYLTPNVKKNSYENFLIYSDRSTTVFV